MTVGSAIVVLSLGSYRSVSCLVSGWCLVFRVSLSESHREAHRKEKKRERKRKGEFVNWYYNTETGPLYTRDREAITNLLSRSNSGEREKWGKVSLKVRPSAM